VGSVAKTWREIPSVLSRLAKPLLGLIVLLALPWLGLGGSARASFVVGQFGSDRAKSSTVPLYAEGAGCGGASYAGTGHEDKPGDEESPSAKFLSRRLLAAGQGLQTGSSIGGASAPGSASGPGGSGPVGILSQTELPAGGLVVYFREPSASLNLSAFIDTLLDPPRQA